ncbi:MAG: ATP-binding protein, partial [Limisphaerales bacterium]
MVTADSVDALASSFSWILDQPQSTGALDAIGQSLPTAVDERGRDPKPRVFPTNANVLPENWRERLNSLTAYAPELPARRVMRLIPIAEPGHEDYKSNWGRIIWIDVDAYELLSTLDAAGKFERGTDVLPTVNAPVFAVAPALIDQVYSSYAEGDFTIGKLSLLPAQQAKINLDAFLTRHAAILGQTGGGKSWAVASIIQKVCCFKQATIVLFDLHGEYTATFGGDADVISATDLELPYWLMNSEELLGLMVDRSESAAPNQIAKFKELLQAAKEVHPENKTLGIKKVTIDTPVFFDFDAILKEFRDLDTQMVAGQRGERQGPLFGQFTRLL